MQTINRLDKLLKLLSVEPDDAFTLYGVAQEYAKLGDHAKAIEHYDRCLAVDPSYCYAYYHKARAQADAGDVPAALRTLTEGLAVARKAHDQKASGELAALRDSLS